MKRQKERTKAMNKVNDVKGLKESEGKRKVKKTKLPKKKSVSFADRPMWH